MSSDTTYDPEDVLSHIFDQSVSVEILEERGKPDARLTVCNMSYRPQSSSSDSGASTLSIRQTAIVFDADELDVPQFALSPRRKGIMGKLIAGLGSFGEMKFDDTPDFSQKFQLMRWVEEPVRILFTKDLRNHLADHKGWSVRGKGRRLVLFHHKTIHSGAELDEFVQDGIQLLQLFLKGEQRLDDRPEVRRQVRPSDMAEAADRIGGLAGTLLRNQLRKYAITRQELESFLDSPPPRTIPPGMKRQVLGDTLIVALLGCGFFIAGIVAGPLTFLLVPGNERYAGLAVLIVFPLIGGTMAWLTMRFRSRKHRILTFGEIGTGTILSVKRTDVTINNQVRHAATVTYTSGSESREVKCHVYGPAAEQARRLQESGESTRILIDTQDPTHVVCLDVLTIFDE